MYMYVATFSSFSDMCHAQNTPRVWMESINLYAQAVVRLVPIDQFVVFCCWLVLFCIPIATFIDTCHAQKMLRVWMESINLCIFHFCRW